MLNVSVSKRIEGFKKKRGSGLNTRHAYLKENKLRGSLKNIEAFPRKIKPREAGDSVV